MSIPERLASAASKFVGTSTAFIGAAGIIIVWAICGPIFAYSDTWQLIINTGTTIITFLMVFLIQRSQNKDTLVIHTKLDEIIRAISSANNCYINIEELSEREALDLHERILKMVNKSEARLKESTLVDSTVELAEAAESAKRAEADKNAADPSPGALKALIEEQAKAGAAHATTN